MDALRAIHAPTPPLLGLEASCVLACGSGLPDVPLGKGMQRPCAISAPIDDFIQGLESRRQRVDKKLHNSTDLLKFAPLTRRW